ncbi:hypothetical protein EYF80_005007 [Liparis tanakae]|uniref:Secreted protein n=1 Tax=Liparis tanakae TaxID=230148 RepID=A0A4Z2J639_9TELE|nr:hypothetical protein EYF80_005007 [Liparis tanakae]
MLLCSVATASSFLLWMQSLVTSSSALTSSAVLCFTAAPGSKLNTWGKGWIFTCSKLDSTEPLGLHTENNNRVRCEDRRQLVSFPPFIAPLLSRSTPQRNGYQTSTGVFAALVMLVFQRRGGGGGGEVAGRALDVGLSAGADGRDTLPQRSVFNISVPKRRRVVVLPWFL